jgi:hypothetical protein
MKKRNTKAAFYISFFLYKIIISNILIIISELNRKKLYFFLKESNIII